MKRVLVAMSGGVDSSVAAALLQKENYEVIGITMQIWPHSSSEENHLRPTCCSVVAIDDARRVASRLGIVHYVLNFREAFTQKVIDYFVNEYRQGRTPNPCIQCNRYIKFNLLLNKCQELGADFLATGHYARRGYDANNGRYLLWQGVDKEKDQSYFLYMLNQYQLARIIFPLGVFTKEEARKMAREWQLAVADKPASQEICFIADNHYGEFFRQYMPEIIKPGPILNLREEVVGEHQGIIFYTIGQRRGLGIGGGKPYYVISIDRERNAIIVGEARALYGHRLIATGVNFIPFERLTTPLNVEAKIRYRSLRAEAIVSPLRDNRVRVEFRRPQRAITPGQAVVFYQGETVIGGGTIWEKEQ